ncbi:hypothetical protein GR157_20270 [Burkholderia sp. 4701]|nr:hypothetical protein [Burkholderia sp. 4701]MXN84091.1 hypothetical protein [Burkholderia sp. 4812]
MQSNTERAVTIMGRRRPFRFRANERRGPSPMHRNASPAEQIAPLAAQSWQHASVHATLPCRVPFFRTAMPPRWRSCSP